MLIAERSTRRTRRPLTEAPGPRPLIYSKTCQQAILAMGRVAAFERVGTRPWMPEKVLAQELRVSGPIIAQIVQRLRLAGLLSGFRGINGGVRLPRPAEEITVGQIAEAIDGVGVAGRCVLGLPPCDDQAQCSAHEAWSWARAEIERGFEHQTLREFSGGPGSQRAGSTRKESVMARNVFVILDELAAGIEELRASLAPLAALTGPPPSPKAATKPGRPAGAKPKPAAAAKPAVPPAKKGNARRTSPKLKALRQMQGQFLGALRRLQGARREELKRIQREKGYEAALKTAEGMK